MNFTNLFVGTGIVLGGILITAIGGGIFGFIMMIAGFVIGANPKKW